MSDIRTVNDAVNDAFGQRVRAAMAISRISRHEMARACAVSPQAVQRWADGTAYPTSGKLMTFCGLTGCSVEWLLFPHPVDLRSTEWALDGKHIKNIVQTVMDELAVRK